MATAAVAAVGGAAALIPLVSQFAPNANTTATREFVEVDLGQIGVGQVAKLTWRDVPVLVKHRTKKQIELARAVDLSSYRDPQRDEDRIKAGNPEWLVVIGVCTNDRCVIDMAFRAEDEIICPCCASAYDSAGRITRGPAPKNLALPPYSFLSHRRLRIG